MDIPQTAADALVLSIVYNPNPDSQRYSIRKNTDAVKRIVGTVTFSVDTIARTLVIHEISLFDLDDSSPSPRSDANDAIQKYFRKKYEGYKKIYP